MLWIDTATTTVNVLDDKNDFKKCVKWYFLCLKDELRWRILYYLLIELFLFILSGYVNSPQKMISRVTYTQFITFVMLSGYRRLLYAFYVFHLFVYVIVDIGI